MNTKISLLIIYMVIGMIVHSIYSELDKLFMFEDEDGLIWFLILWPIFLMFLLVEFIYKQTKTILQTIKSKWVKKMK